MNREELVSKLSERTGEYKYVIEKFVDHYEEIIRETLIGGENVHLHGFITFKVTDHNEKQYVNPMTKETKLIPASKKIKVKVSETLNRQM